jgi:hypothetical protein
VHRVSAAEGEIVQLLLFPSSPGPYTRIYVAMPPETTQSLAQDVRE